MRTNLSVRAALCLFALATGCVRSYRKDPPLAFADLPYTALDGTPWPTTRVPLPELAATYGMPAVPQIAYVELNPQGKQTLLFIHGLGSYLKFWRYQLDHFAQQGYRVVALDMPGYGKSDKPASFPYTMEAMAEVVKELTAKLGIVKPIVVGHSMGGQTALSLAIRYPDLPAAVVLTSPAGFELFSSREKAWFKKVFVRELVTEATEYGIWKNVRQGNFSHWRDELNWLIEERVRMAKNPEFDSYAYAQLKSVEGLTQNDFVREGLDKVTAPTLIVYGNNDRLIPNPFLHGGKTSWVMESGHAKIKGSKLVELAGCGHTVQMDCPDAYNEQVRAFLAAAVP